MPFAAATENGEPAGAGRALLVAACFLAVAASRSCLASADWNSGSCSAGVASRMRFGVQ